jgi:probable urease-associated protein
MNTYRKAILILLSLAFLINPLHLSAQTAAAINGWELQEISRAGVTSSYTAIKHTPNGSYISTAKITPNVGNITKFIGRANFISAVLLAIKGLFDMVDYVMDPENNRVKFTINTGLWTDYDRKIVGNVATVGRYECAKPHGWGGGGGPIVRDYTYAGFAYVKCNNGYGHIWMYKEEKALTFNQIAAQIFKNAQAGQPEAIAAIGKVADEQVTPQWLATQWERNKRPLAKTNGQQNVSPTAIALSQAHRSGRKYGGNCTPKEFNELEAIKEEKCSGSGRISCSRFLSEEEIGRRTEILEQCAIARTTINNKCFAGGDENHRKEASKYWKSYTDCFEILQNRWNQR